MARKDVNKLKPGDVFNSKLSGPYVVVSMGANTQVRPEYVRSVFALNMTHNRVERYVDVFDRAEVEHIGTLRAEVEPLQPLMFGDLNTGDVFRLTVSRPGTRYMRTVEGVSNAGVSNAVTQKGTLVRIRNGEEVERLEGGLHG